jgi:hypothetical protein
MILSSCASYTPPTPEWSKRNAVEMEDENRIWYLGIGESKSLNEAIQRSEANSKGQIAEYLSKAVNVFGKNRHDETNTTSRTQSRTFTYTDVIPVPFKKKRRFYNKDEGKYTVFTDIAVSKSDIANVKETSTPIEFNKAINEDELNMNVENINDDYDRSLSFLEKKHLFHWSPITTEGLVFAHIGYEYSFFERRLGIEVSTLVHQDKDAEYSSDVGGHELENIERHTIELNLSVYKSYKKLFIISVGYVQYSKEKGVDSNYEEDIKEKESYSGISTGIKYKSLFDNSNWGYQLSLYSQKLEGELTKETAKEDKELNNTFGSLGFFYGF